MKKLNITLILLIAAFCVEAQTATEILDKIDENMSSENRVFTSQMVIHGRRGTRTIESKSYGEGDGKAFTEYLAPAREKGTKMLKLEDKLWIYSPSTDRIVQISGHMLRQSVMGSDLSYEDMMEDNKLQDSYNAKIIAEENYNGDDCWVLELTAITSVVTYQKRKLWVVKSKYVPVKEELFAKSGKLLKRTELSDIKLVQGRYFPTRIKYKDMLKDGEGTEFIMTEIEFDVDIPEYIFQKASLKR